MRKANGGLASVCNLYGNRTLFCHGKVSAVSFVTTSDQSVKTDVQDTDLTPLFDAVDCKSYLRTDRPELVDRRVGFIAQHVQKACLDHGLPNTFNADIQQEDGTTILGLDYSRLVTVLWSTCKRQQAALAALEARLRAIEIAIESAK